MGEPVSHRVDGETVTADITSSRTDPGLAIRIQRLLLGLLGIFAVWLLLTASLALPELVAGLLVASLVTLLSSSHLHLLDGVRLGPALPWHLLRFLVTFFAALVQANVDMARRVLSPRLPICPGMVEVRTQLESPLGRLLLANAITLTPGTLSVDIHGDTILVHWVDISPGTDIDRATSAIVHRFERHLREFLR